MKQEQMRRIAWAYAGDAEAFLSPELFAMIWELIQGFLSSCLPASILFQRALPRFRARMLERMRNTVRAHAIQTGELFDEEAVNAAMEKLLDSTNLRELQEAKRA